MNVSILRRRCELERKREKIISKREDKKQERGRGDATFKEEIQGKNKDDLELT